MLQNCFVGKKPFWKKVLFPTPHFPKTFTGIAFITSNKSNSNLFYIKGIQRFTCNNFYCCCINSRLLIFSTANKNLYKKTGDLQPFMRFCNSPIYLFFTPQCNWFNWPNHSTAAKLPADFTVLISGITTIIRILFFCDDKKISINLYFKLALRQKSCILSAH